MAKRGRPKGSKKKLADKCPQCGAEQKTVWMRNGDMLAVDPEWVEVVFCNMAMADGRKLYVYLEHDCEGG